MKLDELRTKYPSHADIIQFEPIPNCRHCHGTGERRTMSRSMPLTVCMCVCVDQRVAEDMQDALSNVAKEMLAEMRAEKKGYER